MHAKDAENVASMPKACQASLHILGSHKVILLSPNILIRSEELTKLVKFDLLMFLQSSTKYFLLLIITVSIELYILKQIKHRE